MTSALRVFNTFDFFAYLGSGFGFICYFFILQTYSQPDGWAAKVVAADSPIRSAFIAVPFTVFFSYTVGHVISQVSYLIIDKGLLSRFLKHPRDFSLSEVSGVAVEESRPSKLFLILLGASNYTAPLPRSVSVALSSRYNEMTGERIRATREVERQCFTIVNETNPGTSLRLQTFLAIRTFCRNTSMILLLHSVMTVQAVGSQSIPLVAFLLLCSWLLLGRYLIFHKFYTDEVYISYSVGSIERSEHNSVASATETKHE
nr:hypothetical protein [Actinomyces naeslundii]